MKTFTMNFRIATHAFLLAGALLASSPAHAAESLPAGAVPATNLASQAAGQAVQPQQSNGRKGRSDADWKKAFPLIIVVLVFVWVTFSTWCDYKKRKELMMLYHQERMAALEKGLELPPFPRELLGEEADTPETPQPTKPGKPLLVGLIWLLFGLGLAVALAGVGNAHFRPAGIGAVPFGIGLAYLIYYAVEARKGSRAQQGGDRRPKA